MVHAEDHNLTKISTRYAEDLETIRDCYLSLKQDVEFILSR